MNNPYINNGFSNREEYLDSLREEYGGLVDVMIGILPPSEDFDGLVLSLKMQWILGSMMI
jgi:hypothetical protein